MNILRKPTGIDLEIEVSENDGLGSSGIDEMNIAEFKLSTEMRLKEAKSNRMDRRKGVL